MGTGETYSGAFAALAARLRAELSSRLARDSLSVLGLSALGRAIAMGKEVLVAALFGVGGALDAYVLALLVPSLLANLLGGSFASALVPLLGRVAKRGNGRGGGVGPAARTFVRRALLAQGLPVLAAALCLALVPAGALGLLAPGAGAERLELVKGLMLALIPLYVLGCANQSLAALTNYRGDFRGPALAGALGALAAVGGIAALHGTLGVQALAVGVVFGALVEFCLLARMFRRTWAQQETHGERADETPHLSPTPGSSITEPSTTQPGTAELAGGWAQLALGAGLLGLTPLIDNAIASTLGEGAVSTLSYAAKLPSGISALLGLTLSTVLLPHFTELARGGAAKVSAGLRGAAARTLMVALPLALAGALGSAPLVDLLYQRGRFDAQAAQAVSAAQAWYFLQLPCYLLGLAGSRMLLALSRFRFLLWMQAVLLVAGGLLSFGLSRLFGASGVAMASVGLYGLSAALSFWGVGRAIGRIRAEAET
jgi:putative peptidoglycan lipid II flippase